MKKLLTLLFIYSNWAFCAQLDADFYLISTTNIYSLKYLKEVEKGHYSYRLLCYADGLKKEIIFESNHNYTSGYLSDKILVLTNNNTEDSPSILIWDFISDKLKEDQLLFSVKKYKISNYMRSSVVCAEDGKCIVHQPIRWHNDQWYETSTNILLRLGDCIPNKCRVMWEYQLVRGEFAVFINTYPDQQQLPHQQIDIERK